MGRTIIVLGATAVGKTTVCQRLALEIQAHNYVQVGVIREIMGLYESDPFLHSSALDSWRLIGQWTPQTVVEGFLKHCSALEIGVLTSIERLSERSERLIVEGLALRPELIERLGIGRVDTCPVLLKCSNEAVHLDRLSEKRSRSLRPEFSSWLEENFRSARVLQEFLIAEFERLGLPTIENIDLDSTVHQISSLSFNRQH